MNTKTSPRQNLRNRVAKNGRKQCPSEHVEQRNFVSWWRKTQADQLFAIPNGGQRGKVAAAKMKLEGQMPGVWDLMAPDRFLWIEFKRQVGGRLSEEQVDFGERREAAGYKLMVAYGCQDAIDQLEGKIRPWREKP